GNAHLADLALGPGVVGVVPHLRGQVEGAAQPRLAGGEEELEPLVGLLRRPEPGVLPHRPRPPPIHLRVDAPGVRRLPRQTELCVRVEALEVPRRVDGLDLDPRVSLPTVITAHPPILAVLAYRRRRRQPPTGSGGCEQRLSQLGNDPCRT